MSEPEVRAGELGVGGVGDAERPRQQHREDRHGDAERGDLPHRRVDDAAEGDERRAHAAVLLPPRPQRQVEADPLDPAADNDQGEPEVEGPARLERRVEGVQHRRLVEQQRHGGHQQAGHHRPEPDLVDGRVRQRPLQPLERGQHREADDEERRPHEGVEHTVQREPLVVALEDRLEQLVEVDVRVLERLQRPEQAADEQGGDGDADVAADEATLPAAQLVAAVGGGTDLRFEGGHPASSSMSAASASSVSSVSSSSASASSVPSPAAASSAASASVTTRTVPNMAACPDPQYSWQM